MFSQVCERKSTRISERPLCKWSAALAVVLLAPAGSILAGPAGELDAGFGVNGRVRFEDAFADRLSIGHAIAEQPADGKLLLAGESVWESAFLAYRLNTDGSLDETFGNGGRVQIEFPIGVQDLSRPWGEATSIAVQPDGRIVIGGRADSSNFSNFIVYQENVGLIRLNPDGTLDSSFGNNGSVVIDLGGGREYLSDLVLLPGGEIVIVGFTDALGDFDAVFARLTPNGTLDTTFGSGPLAGVTIVPFGGYDERPQALVRQADGSLIACGESSRAGTGTAGTVMLAAHVFANGSIDTGFGAGGLARVDASAAASSARDCISLPDGTLLLAGFSGIPGAEDFQLAWLGSDGQLTAQYGQGGLRTLNLGASESIQGMTSVADGSIAVTGLTGTVVNHTYADGWLTSPFPSTRPSEMLFAKLDAFSGQLDPAFGDNGITHIDFGRNNSSSWAYGRGILQTRDGKLAAVGTATDMTALAYSGGHAYPDFAIAQIDLAGAGNPGLVGFVDTESYISGASTVVAEVRRTGGSSGPVSVDYRTVSDTVSAPGDYTAVSGTLVWNDAETTVKAIEIPVHTQDVFAGSISVVLENTTGSLAASEFTITRRQPNFAPPITNYGSGAGASGTFGVSGGGGAFGFDLLILLGLLAWSRRAGRVVCRSV